jgi:hypothetical protein
MERIYYKYTAATWACQILKSRQLKVTPANQFNDPFEFMLRFGDRSAPAALVGEFAKDLRDKQCGVLGVVCLSAIPNSLLMWGHYADSHKGCLIGFDCERLCQHHPPFDSGPVIYADRRAFLGSGSVEGIFRTKFKDWKYEKEYRLIFKLDTLSKSPDGSGGTCWGLTLRRSEK